MKVLITGAGGMLGRDLVRVARERAHDRVVLDREALDITDPTAVTEELQITRPDVVINCAAWTDVDGAEDDERGAMRVNDEAAASLAGAAADVGAAIIQISTDYVFDGEKRSPYLESDLPNPINAYGRSKLGAETSVAIANPEHAIVRTSWLFGLGGRNFVETMLALGERESEVLVVTDQVGCPTWTGHLAEGLLDLAEDEARGIVHLCAAEQCSWFEFAQEIFDQAGVECDVLAATTEMMGRKAPRPAFSVMRSEIGGVPELPDWRSGLSAYLEAREAG